MPDDAPVILINTPVTLSLAIMVLWLGLRINQWLAILGRFDIPFGVPVFRSLEGMGLGATPVGIANVNALTSRYGPSPKAYLVIPLLGAFFIDIANATLVQLLLGSGWFG